MQEASGRILFMYFVLFLQENTWIYLNKESPPILWPIIIIVFHEKNMLFLVANRTQKYQDSSTTTPESLASVWANYVSTSRRDITGITLFIIDHGVSGFYYPKMAQHFMVICDAFQKDSLWTCWESPFYPLANHLYSTGKHIIQKRQPLPTTIHHNEFD